MNKCRVLGTDECVSIALAISDCAKGRLVVLAGSHNVSSECEEDFCKQVGLQASITGEWVWTPSVDGTPGVYYPEYTSERLIGEFEGAMYFSEVQGVGYEDDIYEGVSLVCETRGTVVIMIDESYEVE
jgi:hypothetical protein